MRHGPEWPSTSISKSTPSARTHSAAAESDIPPIGRQRSTVPAIQSGLSSAGMSL
jgi:hypothetical protein